MNIELSKNNTVATRVRDYNYGIVCVSNPVSIGQMFKVNILVQDQHNWSGGLGIGLTGENPEASALLQSPYISQSMNDKQLFYIGGEDVFYKGNKLSKLIDFNTWQLKVGQSLGILLTRERDIHWFVDNKWIGMVHVNDYPLDRPMWGVANVYGTCKQVKADICSVSGYNKSLEGQLVKSGVIVSPPETRPAPLRQTQPQEVYPDQGQPDLLHQLLQEQESLRQEVQRKDSWMLGLQRDLSQERVAVSSLRTEIHQLQLQVTWLNSENRRLQQQVTQSDGENRRLQQQVTHSDGENRRLQQQVTHSDGEYRRLQQQVSQSDGENRRLQQQVVALQHTLSSHSGTTRSTTGANSQEIEFWQVSPEEVSIRDDQVLGGGAWGYVAKGMFRGTAVAVKRVYPSILQQSTLDRIRREIRTMAQIRHPNLVLFIAAVLNEQTGPMIVTEILDISLRQAYQANRVGANKLKIFRDISSALVYLHQQREPIIHRDVSSANVLLISSPNDTWLAKLSDFGSANLARYATTPGEGAILYTAPEAYPHPPASPTPSPPQTTKIDVYSFGVLACEVITHVFPESDRFTGLMATVSRSWPQIHQLVSSCVSRSPQYRPTMVTVLARLQQLESEP